MYGVTDWIAWTPCFWGRTFYLPEWCKICLSNQGRSQVHIWQPPRPRPRPTAQIKIADTYTAGLNFKWKKRVGRAWAGERASSTGSAVIKAQEAEHCSHGRERPLWFLLELHQWDLHTHITLQPVLLSGQPDTRRRKSDGAMFFFSFRQLSSRQEQQIFCQTIMLSAWCGQNEAK